jgi:GNAT superfamily N-acetyltransferase
VSLLNCKFCRNAAVYKCSECGTLVCGVHAKGRLVCPSCLIKSEVKYTVQKASSKKEKDKIKELVTQFWGEEEQLTFDRKFDVAKQPAYVAKVGTNFAGFASFSEDRDNLIVVALGIWPEYQGSGIGQGLIRRVEAEAIKIHKKRILVSTSNDDLPALGFYQSQGFQVFEVKPNVIAHKHGKILAGIGGLPIRDELRLQKVLE